MCKKYQYIVFSLVLLLISINRNPVTAGTISELVADDVSDGPCLSVTELMPHLYSGVDLMPVLASGTYYVPMGSRALYRKYAEGLLGRPATSQGEIDSMRLELRCGPLFSTIENIGFPYLESPPRFTQTCFSAGIPSFPNLGLFKGNLNLDYVQAVCLGLPAIRPDGSVALHASSAFVSTMDSIIWVNADESVLLAYRCPSDGQKDYKIVSKTKTLRPEDIEAIRSKVIELGFREENIAFMNYDEQL